MAFAVPLVAAAAAASIANAPFVVAALGATGAAIAGGVVAAGIAFAGQALLGPDAPSAPGGPPLPSKFEINPLELSFSSNPPRRIVYGKTRISGSVVYANVAGEGNRDLYMVIALATHVCDGIDEIYFNGEPASENFAGFYEYWFYAGHDDQAASSILVNTFSEWTDQHRLRGIAYAVVRLTWDKEVYRSGRPNITFGLRGKRLWDPRDATVRWCSNAALASYDYMLRDYGMQIDGTDIDEESVKAAADICDQQPDGLSASLCDGRYTVDGVIEVSQKTGEVLANLLTAMAGTVVWTGGQFRMYAGAATSPSAKIDRDDLRGEPSLQPKLSIDQSFNAVKGTFLDATSKYQLTDYPPVTNATYEAQDGGRRKYKDLSLPFTTSPVMAQRIATIFLRRARLEKTVSLPCKWTVFNVEVWDVIELSLPEFNWVDKQFLVTEYKIKIPTANDGGGVDLTLQEYDPDIFNDDIDVTPVGDTPEIGEPDQTIPGPPSNLSLSAGTSDADPETGEARLRLAWTPSSDVRAIGYEYRVRRRGGSWSVWLYVLGAGTSQAYHTPVTVGRDYEAELRTRNDLENVSSVIAAGYITIDLGTGSRPPNVVTATASVDGTAVTLSWSPVDAADLAGYEVRWSPTGSILDSAWRAAPGVGSTVLTLTREAQDGTYLIFAVSDSGRYSENAATVDVDGVGVTGSLLTRAQMRQGVGSLSGGVWYDSTTVVPASASLAANLDWEVFDEVVPNPVGLVEWRAPGVALTSGHTNEQTGVIGALPYPGSINNPAKVTVSTVVELSTGDLLVASREFNVSENAVARIGWQFVPETERAIVTSTDLYLKDLSA